MTLAVVAGTVSSLAVPAAAFAGKAWSPPRIVSNPDEPANFPDVALNRRERGAVVWLREEEDNAFTVRAAKRVPGKAFQPPYTVGPAVLAAGGNPPSLPKVAIDRDGNAIAVWVMNDPDGDPHVVASFQPRGGKFGEIETLSQQVAFQPDVAFNESGRAIAVWQRLEPTLGHPPRFNVQAAIKPADERNFGQPQTLSALGLNAQFPQAGMSDAGQAVVIWRTDPPQDGGGHFVEAAINPADKPGGFDEPQRISDPDLDADEIRLAVARGGQTMAAWTEVDPAKPAIQQVGDIGTAFAPRGGPFHPPETISPQSGMDAFAPRIAIDRRARATVLWIETPPLGIAGTRLVRAARTNGNGKFTDDETLERTGEDGDLVVVDPAVTVAGAGNGVGAWIRAPIDQTRPSELDVAVRKTGKGEFGPTETLSPPSVFAEAPSLAATGDIAIAVWERDKLDEDGNQEGAGVLANVYR